MDASLFTGGTTEVTMEQVKSWLSAGLQDPEALQRLGVTQELKNGLMENLSISTTTTTTTTTTVVATQEEVESWLKGELINAGLSTDQAEEMMTKISLEMDASLFTDGTTKVSLEQAKSWLVTTLQSADALQRLGVTQEQAQWLMKHLVEQVRTRMNNIE